MKFYLATNYLNKKDFKYIKQSLEKAGWKNTFDWVDWASNGEKLNGEYNFQKTAELEAKGIKDADIVIFLLPGARGTHFEMGYAKALGKKIVLHSNDIDLFKNDAGGCPFYHFNDGTVEQILCKLEELPNYLIGKKINDIKSNEKILKTMEKIWKH